MTAEARLEDVEPLETALWDSPPLQEVHHQALSFLSERDPHSAMHVLHKTLEGSPTDGIAHFLLGLLHEEQRNHPQAILSYRRAVESTPPFLEARLRLGRLLLHTGNDAMAHRHYRHLMGIRTAEPHHAGFHLEAKKFRALSDLAVHHAAQGRVGLAHGIAEHYAHHPRAGAHPNSRIPAIVADSAAIVVTHLTIPPPTELVHAHRLLLEAESPQDAATAYAQILPHARRDFSLGSRWEHYEAWGTTLLRLQEFTEAAACFLRATFLATYLPHPCWIQSAKHHATSWSSIGDLSLALELLEEACWIESITACGRSSLPLPELVGHLSAHPPPEVQRFLDHPEALRIRRAYEGVLP